MNRLFESLFVVVILFSFTNCSTTPEITYSTCGHGSNQYDQVRLVYKNKVELLKLSSTPDGFLVDSIRIQGGVQSFISKIIYPEIAKRAGVEGINGASFIVDSLGNAIDIKLIK